MVKKVIRIGDSIKVSDSIHVTVIRRVIIPLNFVKKELEVNYFIPRFKKISKGEEIEWVNDDKTNHHLEFYDVLQNRVNFLFELGPIKPGKTNKRKFDLNNVRIDYVCKLHDNEVGTIIIYPKPEDQMTNTQQLQFLDKIFDIRPPPILRHLRSP
jgi:plastocyanin